MTKSDITWAAVRLDISDNTIKQMLDEVLAVPENMWHFNNFRGCYLLPLYNSGGQLGSEKAKGGKTNLAFSPAGELCPTLKEVVLNKIFPWMDPPGRVTILRTPAGYGLNTHFDVSEHEIGTLQEKFRLVLNGNIEKLWFYDDECNKVHIPQNYKAYVMDGGHPHSLDPGNEEKITLCIGAPWYGNRTEAYQELLDKSPFKMTIRRPDTFKEEWLDPFWRK